ncbi:hypothetical protein GCM10028793_16120 [Nocardiopsis oceani]
MATTLRRAAETATIKRQEKGENHPHKTAAPLPQQPQYPKRAHPADPLPQRTQHPHGRTHPQNPTSHAHEHTHRA